MLCCAVLTRLGAAAQDPLVLKIMYSFTHSFAMLSSAWLPYDIATMTHRVSFDSWLHYTSAS